MWADADGAAAETYAEGSTAYLRLEDHNFNQPGNVDTVSVTVTGNADFETVFLTETGPDTGVYQGYLALGINLPVTPNNGVLQAMAGQQIVATHQDLSGATSTTAQALLTDGMIHFVDEAGEVTAELLAGGDGWLRVFSRGANYDPWTPDVITVEVFSQLGGDYEMFGLTETGPDTSVFVSRIPLALGLPASFDERLQVGVNDTVTARFVTLETTARTVAARISFRNLRDEAVTSYALGSQIRVRVEEPSHGGPSEADVLQMQVVTGDYFDLETVTLTETGPATGGR